MTTSNRVLRQAVLSLRESFEGSGGGFQASQLDYESQDFERMSNPKRTVWHQQDEVNESIQQAKMSRLRASRGIIFRCEHGSFSNARVRS